MIMFAALTEKTAGIEKPTCIEKTAGSMGQGRALRGALIALSVFWGSVLVGGSAFAQEESVNSAKTRVSGWVAQCGSAARKEAVSCNVDQSIFLADANQQLAKVSVRVPGDTRKPEMVIQLPHGLYLPSGVDLQFDDKAAAKQVVHTCDGNGCYVILSGASNMVAQMQKGTFMKLTFKNLGRDDITISIPLDGFTAAFKKVE
jgi:invasion protein IalB